MNEEMSLADRLELMAHLHPNRPAIVAGNDIWSYARLAAVMTQAAAACIDRGISPGDRVVLFFDQGPIAWAALFAVWRSGAIAVPLSASQPSERLRRMFNDAAPRLIVTDAQHARDVNDAFGNALPIILMDDLVAERPDRHEWPRTRAQTPAIILYTSGSDGWPKGVIQTHTNFIQKTRVCADAFGTTPADRFAIFSTYTVGQGIMTALNALLFGAALCPYDVRHLGLEALADWLKRERITIYVSSASLFRSFVRGLDGPARFDDLRMIRIGGERVTPADVAAYRRVFISTTRLLISYSATETGPISMHWVDDNEQYPDAIVPVGRPADGVTVLIVGDDGRELGAGDQGEIVVRSAYMSPGYWGDAAQTAAAFAAAPNSNGERDYRTGDLGRVRAGRLEHLGRKGYRVKIRGFRIELEEVETALHNCPGILRAAVAVKPDVDGEPRLVGYTEPAPDSAPTADTIRASLAQQLPDHMIPSAFVLLEKLPMTESGKVDRALLPDPPRDRPVLSSAWAPAATALEAAIARIWSDVLGIEPIGMHDAFLSIGGDSLKATQVAARLSSELQVSISLSDMLEASTIADLATLLKRNTSPA